MNDDPIRLSVEAARKRKNGEYEQRLMGLGKPSDVDMDGADPIKAAVHNGEHVEGSLTEKRSEKPRDSVDVRCLVSGNMPAGWTDRDTTGDWILDQILIQRDGSL